MQQLILFPMTTEAQSLSSQKKQIWKNNLSSSDSITASKLFEDDINIFRFNNDEDPENWGDIYDDYEDFDVTSRTWH